MNSTAENKVVIDKRSWDQITMKARARVGEREIAVAATWAWAPELSWYNETDKRWIYPSEWKWAE